jgi:hypothetical protein
MSTEIKVVPITEQEVKTWFDEMWKETLSASRYSTAALPVKIEAWNNFIGDLCDQSLITVDQCEIWSNCQF